MGISRDVCLEFGENFILLRYSIKFQGKSQKFSLGDQKAPPPPGGIRLSGKTTFCVLHYCIPHNYPTSTTSLVFLQLNLVWTFLEISTLLYE